MDKVVCLRHPRYVGDKNPDLRCKACCAVFIQRIKLRNFKQAEEIGVWLDSKISRETLFWTI